MDDLALPVVTYRDSDAVISYGPTSDVDDAAWYMRCVGGQRPSWPSGHIECDDAGTQRMAMTAGAWMAFSFFGSSVQLFGELNASRYLVALDGWPVADESDASGEIIMSLSDLKVATHYINLTVLEPGERFRINRAVFDTTLSRRENVTIASNGPDWTYAGADWTRLDVPWPSNSSRNPQFVSTTSTTGDSAVLTFQGDAVALIGNSQIGYGKYDVNLDGTVSTYNARSFVTMYRGLMFFAAGLDLSVEHRLSITNAQQTGLGFEYALVLRTDYAPPRSSTSSSATHQPNPTSSAASGSGHGTTVIVAIAVVVPVAVCLVLVTVFVAVRRARRQAAARQLDAIE